MARYRLKYPILGVERTAEGMHLTQIDAGEILIVREIAQDQGLIELVVRGKLMSIFVQDLVERGERIKSAASVSVIRHDSDKVC